MEIIKNKIHFYFKYRNYTKKLKKILIKFYKNLQKINGINLIYLSKIKFRHEVFSMIGKWKKILQR